MEGKAFMKLLDDMAFHTDARWIAWNKAGVHYYRTGGMSGVIHSQCRCNYNRINLPVLNLRPDFLRSLAAAASSGTSVSLSQSMISIARRAC